MLLWEEFSWPRGKKFSICGHASGILNKASSSYADVARHAIFRRKNKVTSVVIFFVVMARDAEGRIRKKGLAAKSDGSREISAIINLRGKNCFEKFRGRRGKKRLKV